MNYPRAKEKSERILHLQKALNLFGAELEEDGFYGESTRETLNKVYLAKEDPIHLTNTFRDMYTAYRVKQLHPRVIDKFSNFILEAEAVEDIVLRITQGYVPIAESGQSYHNYGLAVDLVRMEGGIADWDYDMGNLEEIANKYGITWGGGLYFTKQGLLEKQHFEIRFGYNWRVLLNKYLNKDFIPNTKYVKL